MGHKHSVRDTNAHFTIDQFTRQIKNDSAEKTTIVQYDHNSQRLTFEMPLYIDSHAMTLCDLIEIHYINISTDGKSQNDGTYEVNDIKAEGEKAIFTWLISQEATQLAGSLSFFIVFKCTENGVTVYRWGTEICKTLAISAGMDNGEAVLTEYPDILAQWKAQLFDASDTAVVNVATAEASALAAIEAAGEAKKQSVLDSIPDEYEALSQDVSTNAARINELASAIKGELSGAVVRADDVSPVGHLPTVKVRGKNLFDISKIQTADASVSYAYISEVGTDHFVIRTEEGYDGNGYCTVPIPLKEVCPSLEIGKTYILTASTESNSTNMYLPGIQKSWIFGKAIVVTEAILNSAMTFYGLSAMGGYGTGDCRISNIQIEEGETATEYTPYIDPATVTVKRCGKNWWNTLKVSYPFNQLGLTISYDEETNTYTFNGTSTSASNIYVVPNDTLDFHAKKGETWHLTAEVIGGSSKDAEGGTDTAVHIAPIVATKDYGLIFPAKTGKHTFLEDTVITKMYFYVYKKDIVFNNLKMRVQLEANKATEFEPYKGETKYTPGLDGVVPGVASVAPTMTIMTDTPGVTVECEYNVDTKTYIDNKIKEMMEVE